jgi:hypothetical protein
MVSLENDPGWAAKERLKHFIASMAQELGLKKSPDFSKSLSSNTGRVKKFSKINIPN